MGHSSVKVAICILASTAGAFTSLSTFHGRINIRHANPSFLSMEAGASMPEGEFDGGRSSSSEGGRSSSSEEAPQDMTPSFKPMKPAMKFPAASHSSPDEMLPLQSQSVSPERRKRFEHEKEISSRFLHGDELFELREYIKKVEVELDVARDSGFGPRIVDTQKALEEAKGMDAEYVYVSCLENAMEAQRLGLVEEAEELHKEAMEARSLLPQFNLEGLWVGKYGDHGYEMINVTYVGDNLTAMKVTGDNNVPKGEITFKADLSPTAVGQEGLGPIELSDVASKQWGQKHLNRFPGNGQVAAEGFTDKQYVDGQLILVGEYFSFAWVPLGHQIFFGRPSAELTLRMLKESNLADFGAVDHRNPNELAEMRAVAQRCLEETEMLIDDDDDDIVLNFISEGENYFTQDGCFQ